MVGYCADRFGFGCHWGGHLHICCGRRLCVVCIKRVALAVREKSKIAVVGSRGYPDEWDVRNYIWTLRPMKNSVMVISGGAKGPDTWARLACARAGIYFRLYEADWNTHGKSAGPLRNYEMAVACDKVVAFWDGESRGTLDMIRKARDLEKPILIHVKKER